MNRVALKSAAAALVLLTLVIAGPTLWADTFEVTSVDGMFSNTVGGTNVGYFNPGGDGYNQVRWGTDVGNGQSGLGFLGGIPPTPSFPYSIALDTEFTLGDLIHYNRAIRAGTAASSTELDITAGLNINGLPVNPDAFEFTMLINETPNQEPCTFPSGLNPCADQITFQNISTSDTFTFEGFVYTLQLTGFSIDGGATVVPDFISQEGTDNHALLVGLLSRRALVPEPSSLLLIGIGLSALGLVMRRKRQ